MQREAKLFRLFVLAKGFQQALHILAVKQRAGGSSLAEHIIALQVLDLLLGGRLVEEERTRGRF